jgi:iron transport multicopper oxidase
MLDQSMFDSPSANPNTTAWLVYNTLAPNPEPAILSVFFEFDDTELIPLNPLPVTMYDAIITLDVNFATINGINFAIINDNTYVAPNVPAIFTALTTGQDATTLAVYGNTTNSFVLNHLDMIWLVINNDDDGAHPCIPLFYFIIPYLTIVHLHGHSFQVLFRSDAGAGHFNPEQPPEFAVNPVRRDVILVNGGGFAIIAFRADNPGVW